MRVTENSERWHSVYSVTMTIALDGEDLHLVPDLEV
jgi:hypothetical protein